MISVEPACHATQVFECGLPFGETFPELPERAFLEGTAPASLQSQWDKASAEDFCPR